MKNRSYSPQVVPWKAAETAERTGCPAGRVEAPSPPPPRPAPRLHAAEKRKVKIKINYHIFESISHIKVQISNIYYLPLGTRALSSAGITG